MSLLKQIFICLFVLAAAFGGWYVYNDPQLMAVARSALPAAEARETPPGAQPDRAASRSGVRGRSGAMHVIAAHVKRDRVEEVLIALGTAKANRSVSIFAQVTGIVEEVAFTPGETVEAGALLVRLDDAEQTIAVERARLARDDAREALERAQRLAERGTIAEVALAEARTAVRVTEIELRNAEIALGRRQIVAPFAGITGLTDTSEGDLVSSNAEIVSLDDVSAVRVGFEVPERWSGRIHRGLDMRAAVPGLPGSAFVGTVTAIDSRIDPVSRTLRLEATIDNEGQSLKPGMSVRVEIAFAGEGRLVVPSLAVQWDRGGSFIWKLDGDTVRRAAVTIVRRLSGAAIVAGDVAAGDRVVVEGVQRLRDGATVAVLGEETRPDVPLASQIDVRPDRARN
jgi:RND family efflux transporter MFP subunit